MSRHSDFQRIYDEFISYYNNRVKGETEYYSWIHALGVDESKPYGSARESFKWAKTMLNFLKEDADAKYYGVIVGLPWRSMNGNIYKERDLIAAALSLKGKHPSLNHKDEFWFNESNRYGVLTVEDAKYEDGAVEAILKVPKTAVCPICNGAKMTELIDKQRIVNVSLEGNNNGAFEFTDPPFTLLTSDVLPGIPLARIKPLEKIVSEALQSHMTGDKKTMVIKATIKEDSNQKIQQPPVNVNTRSMADPEFRGEWGTPIASDAALHTNTDSSGNTAVSIGESPANKVMDNTYPHIDAKHHTSGEQAQEAAEQCPVGTKFNPETGKCEPCQTESNPPTYAGDPYTTNLSSPPVYAGVTDPGAGKTKPPSAAIPDAGSLPPHIHPTVTRGTSPGSIGVVMGNSPVESLPSLEERRARVKAELKAKNTEEQALAWEQKHNEAYQKLAETNARYTELSRLHEQLKEDAKNERALANQKIENTIIKMEKAITDYNAVAGDKLKLEQKFQELTEAYNAVNKKYNDSLATNLALSQKLTAANEDYLGVAKKLETKEEELERTKILAKKITRITA